MDDAQAGASRLHRVHHAEDAAANDQDPVHQASSLRATPRCPLRAGGQVAVRSVAAHVIAAPASRGPGQPRARPVAGPASRGPGRSGAIQPPPLNRALTARRSTEPDIYASPAPVDGPVPNKLDKHGISNTGCGYSTTFALTFHRFRSAMCPVNTDLRGAKSVERRLRAASPTEFGRCGWPSTASPQEP